MKTNNKTAIDHLFLGLTLVFLSISCNDHENTVSFMNPQDICGYKIHGEQLKVKFNNEETDKCEAEFIPIKEEPDKLLMKLYKLFPMQEEIDIVVNITSDETNILFAGKVNRPLYELEVSGKATYFTKTKVNTPSNPPFVDIQCNYKVAASNIYVETPYIFKLNKNSMEVVSGSEGTVEWEGKNYSKWDFVSKVIKDISERLSQETTALKLVFHENSYLDISLQFAGNQDFTSWMSLRYWLEEDTNIIYLEHTDEQINIFFDQWTGKPPVSSYPFIHYDSNRNLLPIFFTSSMDNKGMAIAEPHSYSIIYRYVEAKGSEGRTEKELQELQLFQNILQEDQKNNGWCIMMTYE